MSQVRILIQVADYIRRFGSEPYLITIGDDVTICSGVTILTHHGSTGLVRDPDGRRYYHYAPVVIGNNVFIGVNSIILPGVIIGSSVVIGAGSVVTRDVPDGSVMTGNPAQLLSDFENFRQRIAQTCVNDSELDGIDRGDRIVRAVEIAATRRRLKSRNHGLDRLRVAPMQSEDA